MMRRLVFILVLLLCGCSSTPAALPTSTVALTPMGPAPTPIPSSPLTPYPPLGTPVLPPDVSGRFVFAPGDGSIWIQDSPTSRTRVLIEASKDRFSEAPAFSPDGRWIVFRQTALDPNKPAIVSLQVIGAEGTNARTLIAAPNVQSEVHWPAFSPDGQTVYFTLDSADHKHSEIRRVPFAGGESSKVLDDGREASPSHDGKRLTFVRFNVDRFTSGLWVADSDGSHAQPLLRDDTFLTIGAPRFSPDGSWILFAASGAPRHDLKAEATHLCEPWLLCALSTSARADGLPWDLWLIGPGGNGFRQLTLFGGDSPWPAWSKNGKYIAFFQTNGTYLLDVNVGSVTQLSKNGGHGIMDWWSEK